MWLAVLVSSFGVMDRYNGEQSPDEIISSRLSRLFLDRVRVLTNPDVITAPDTLFVLPLGLAAHEFRDEFLDVLRVSAISLPAYN